ncbi:hypothetical protein AGMMS4952_01470 [Spirochaetia bacterium]|nr:hypothetical protein AGMMS4952_01470 [Spirochaetia bacterium]
MKVKNVIFLCMTIFFITKQNILFADIINTNSFNNFEISTQYHNIRKIWYTIQSPNGEFTAINEDHWFIIITNKKNEIIQKKIKPLDALHLSCAITVNVDYFITVDDDVLKYNTNEIKIFDPVMFIKHWERQGEQND